MRCGLWKVLFFLYTISRSIQGLTVIDFTKSLDSTSSSGFSYYTLRTKTTTKLPEQFAICVSLFVNKFTQTGMFQFYDKYRQPWFYLMVTVRTTGYNVWVEGSKIYTKLATGNPFELHAWYHTCLSVDTVSGSVQLVINGGPLWVGKVVPSFQNSTSFKPDTLSGNLVVGIYNSTADEKVYQNFWRVSNINVYTARSVDQLVNITKNMCTSKGDHLAWESADVSWEATGNDLEIISMDSGLVCIGKIRRISVNSLLTQSDAALFCSNIGAQLPTFTNQSQLQAYMDWWNPFDCEEGFIGYTDIAKDGTWANMYTGIEAPFRPFNPGQPNGGTSDNCGTAKKSWHPACFNDNNCDKKMCFSCVQEEKRFLRLYGLCKDSILDNIYTWVNKKIDPILSGWKTTDIRYVESEELWLAQVELPGFNPGYTWASSKASKESMLMGTHEWKIYNESRACTTEDIYSVNLTISSCNSSQFTCAQGSCIDMGLRCDGKSDCIDKSDENNCVLVVLEDSYNPNIKPPPKSGFTKADVEINIQLISILQMKEMDQKFYTKYLLKTNWTDSRLTFYNIKRDEEMNLLSPNEMQRIWVPQLLFPNTQQSDETLMDEKSFIKIIPSPDFKFTRSSLSASNNIYIFSGAENMLMSTRTYSTEWICEYDMSWYPFDTQTCFMDFIVKGNADRFLNLLPNRLEYLGPQQLTQYFIRDTSICSANISGKIGARVKVVLGRPLLSNILTTFLPTLLLNIIGHATNYFKPFFFEALISVNLTVMLVLATMFVSVSQSLPNTSYIKMIDVWMLFNLTIPFVETLLHTYADLLRETEEEPASKEGVPGNNSGWMNKTKVNKNLVAVNEKTQMKALDKYYERRKFQNVAKLRVMNHISKTLNPLIAILFVLAFWSVGMLKYNDPFFFNKLVNTDCV